MFFIFHFFLSSQQFYLNKTGYNTGYNQFCNLQYFIFLTYFTIVLIQFKNKERCWTIHSVLFGKVLIFAGLVLISTELVLVFAGLVFVAWNQTNQNTFHLKCKVVFKNDYDSFKLIGLNLPINFCLGLY